MTDLYQVLGVSSQASAQEIKSAYRKLAKALHPDRNAGDAGVADRFKAVSAANSILADAKLRKCYDRGEIDANGQKRAARRPAPGNGAPGGRPRPGFTAFRQKLNRDDLFAEIFGQRKQAREDRKQAETGRQKAGEDRHYRLTVSFLEAAAGARKRLALDDGKTLVVRVPKAVDNGQQIRLKGQGAAGAHGGRAGDALVEIIVEPHPQFTRLGRDIHLELPITLPEAVLGARIKVPTIAGPVTMTVPKGSSADQVLRLAGKGLAGADGKPPGDQLISLKIVLPRQPDKELERVVSHWAKTNDYHVRQDRD